MAKNTKESHFKIKVFLMVLLLIIIISVSSFKIYQHFTENSALPIPNQITLTPSVIDKFPKNYNVAISNDPQAMQFNILTPHQSHYVAKLLNKDRFIGTALIIKNGKPIFKKSYGYADFATHRLNKPDDVYQLASVQKSITGVLIMQEIDAGKMSFDDHISKYYPSIPKGNQITIRQMLDMTSGISCDTLPHKMMSTQGFINYYLHHLKVSNIGTWNYQPVNYNLLTGILERLTGQSYQSLVRERIIEPLHLHATGFVFNWHKLPNYTQGYALASLKYPYQRPIYEPNYAKACQLGTGNMYSSANDLYLLEKDIIAGKIISQTNLAKLRDAHFDGQYVGGIYTYHDHYMSHGLIAGFEATIVISRDGQDAVVLLSNRNADHYSPAAATRIFEMIK